LLGLLAVLAVTFTAGALAGRLSLRPSPSSAQSADRTKTTAATPELTFYRELTAPLTPRPVPPKPTARPGKREAAEAPRAAEPSSGEAARRVDAPKLPETPRAAETPKPAAESSKSAEAKSVELPKASAGAAAATPKTEAGRYTIQVGAYNGRAQAEALKARMLADGHDAYVAEGEANGVTRYRVRIGSFPSADEARKAAARLASQSQVATFITTR
jgi:DedD protein